MMSNKKRTSFEEFNWSEIQEKYIEALKSFNPSQYTNDSIWVTAMDDWWKTVKSEIPNESETLFEKVLGQYRNYYFISEQFANLIDGINRSKGNSKNVISFIEKKFKEMESIFANKQDIFSWHSLVDGFEQPADLLKQFFSKSPIDNSLFFQQFAPAGMADLQDKLLSMPGLGYSREVQDKIKEAIRLWTDYQDNYQAYQAAMLGLNQDALQLMRKRIINMSKKNEGISSMRQIYHMWIDANEKVYGDYVNTKEYATLNGRLINSLMAFRKQSQEIAEDVMSSMNMPTKKAMSELEKRHHELRKQVKALQQEVASLKQQSGKKARETVVSKKELEPSVSRKKKAKKKAKKKTVSKQTKVVHKKKAKKKASKKATVNAKSTRKKTKRVTKKTTPDKGMIEIKF